MNLILGVGSLSVTTLVFAWAYGAHLRPVPARWTQTPLSMLLCVGLVELAAFGIGFVVLTALNPGETLASLSVVDAVVTAALATAAILFTKRLMAPAYQRPSADVIHLVPPMAPRPVSGGRKRARAA